MIKQIPELAIKTQSSFLLAFVMILSLDEDDICFVVSFLFGLEGFFAMVTLSKTAYIIIYRQFCIYIYLSFKGKQIYKIFNAGPDH